jgi:transcriptional regulator with XRE-family HTH domain
VGSSTKKLEGRRSIFRIKRDTTAADPRCAKVSRAYVAVLEAGHRKNPSPEILKRLAKALGVSRGDLLA